MIGRLLKTWIILISIVLALIGIFFGVLKLLFWWRHPYTLHALGVIAFLGFCLYGACIVEVFRD